MHEKNVAWIIINFDCIMRFDLKDHRQVFFKFKY